MKRVHVEFQRVQTWLFAVPRLRAMVGANTLLGETLRVVLPGLARKGGSWKLAPIVGGFPAPHKLDPLKDHDDPAADARDGILSRDGGHFEASFASGAEEFAREAARVLRRDLPGLRFRIWVDDVPQETAGGHMTTELPVLAPCQWTGQGLASAIVKQGNESASVSIDVARRHEAAKRTQDGTAADLAGLLGATTGLNALKRPQELKELVGQGYLALVHADGNGVGRGAEGSDVERARFFHRNRVLLRRALKEAIDAACEGETARAPLIPLMLGGDDLLIVCRASKALPLVVSLCDALARFQREDPGSFEPTLGVGVVFAKATIPIHRLHEIAEQLAGSAKRRFRGLEPESAPRSFVDWAVFSTAWVDDPETVRRRDWLRGDQQELRVLSQRPVEVLGNGLDSLQGLVAAAQGLEGAPRSQLRYLVEQLPQGRMLSELAFAELSPEARSALKKAGVETPWRNLNPGTWITSLLDLVEVFEIARLGRITSKSKKGAANE